MRLLDVTPRTPPNVLLVILAQCAMHLSVLFVRRILHERIQLTEEDARDHLVNILWLQRELEAAQQRQQLSDRHSAEAANLSAAERSISDTALAKTCSLQAFVGSWRAQCRQLKAESEATAAAGAAARADAEFAASELAACQGQLQAANETELQLRHQLANFEVRHMLLMILPAMGDSASGWRCRKDAFLHQCGVRQSAVEN